MLGIIHTLLLHVFFECSILPSSLSYLPIPFFIPLLSFSPLLPPFAPPHTHTIMTLFSYFMEKIMLDVRKSSHIKENLRFIPGKRWPGVGKYVISMSLLCSVGKSFMHGYTQEHMNLLKVGIARLMHSRCTICCVSMRLSDS